MAEYSDLIGVPFAYNGRDPQKALDCYGLLKELYKRDGVDLPDYVTHSEAPESIAAIMVTGRELWRRTPLAPGRLLLIRLGIYYWHVGYYLGDDEFIHTSLSTGGVCIERYSTWINLIEDSYEYVGSPRQY